MADFTILVRLRDAYPLVEDPGKDQNTKLRKQAFTCLKALSDQYRNQRNDTETQSLVISCNQQYKFYVTMGSNLMILTVFESKVAPPIAVSFLSDVRKLFIEEIRREHGAPAANNVANTIDQVSVAYQYIRLDRAIQRKRNEFKDSTRNDSLRRLNHSLDEVSTLMQRNINDLLMRGENLEAVSDKADQLRESSRHFARQAKRLSKGAWLQTYGPFIAAGLVILIIIIVLML